MIRSLLYMHMAENTTPSFETWTLCYVSLSWGMGGGNNISID